MILRDVYENAEQSAWSDMFAAAPSDFAAGAGLAYGRDNGVAAFAVRAAPVLQFNRAQTLGLDGLSDQELDALLNWLARSCGPVWSLQVLSDSRDRLRSRGLRATSSWTKFQRPAIDGPNSTSALDIRAADVASAAHFGAIVQKGFDAPPPFAHWAAALVERRGWTAYLAYDGDAPVAAAALFMDGDIGWLGLGCCLVSHRRRGAQSALLARRIADAHRYGASVVVTETGTPGPGEEGEHPSFRNIRRAGFEPVYERLNFQPTGQLSHDE